MSSRDQARKLLAFLLLGSMLGFLACGGGGGGGSSAGAGNSGSVSTGLAVTSVSPDNGTPGSRIRILGSGFVSNGALAATLGGQSLQPNAISDTELWGYAPDPNGKLLNGPLILTAGGSTLTTQQVFNVTVGLPQIAALWPIRGPVGTTVTVYGQNLGGVTSVTFGAATATAANITNNTTTSFQVAIPAGATSAQLVVTTLYGDGQSTSSFAVTAGPAAMSLSVLRAYITQGPQRPDGSVPLVTGRNGYLRVFVEADQATTMVPAVNALIRDANGNTLLSQAIPAPAGGVSNTTIDDAQFSLSWNLPLPGSAIQPGATLVVTATPPAGYQGDTSELSFPATGSPMPLSPVTVAPLGVRMFPIQTGDGSTGSLQSATIPLASWADALNRIYPLETINIQVGPVFESAIVLGAQGSVGRLLMDLRWKQITDGAGAAAAPNPTYYYGVFAYNPLNATNGMSIMRMLGDEQPNSSGIGNDRGPLTIDGQNGVNTFVHEMGHMLGQAHSPCGDAPKPNPAYPYPDGNLGANFMVVDQGTLRSATSADDIMSYCWPRLISDWTYENVLNFRAQLPSAELPAEQCLVIAGSVLNGAVTLEPAFELMTPPDPSVPGDYTLLCLDAPGNVLLAVPFTPDPIEDDSGDDLEGFTLAVPMTPTLLAGLASVTVLGPGESMPGQGVAEPAVKTLRRAAATRTRSAGSLTLAKGGTAREPVARSLRPGQVTVGWDSALYPMVIVRDPRTSDTIAIARGGSMDLTTDAPELELIFSDGLRSFTRTLKVQP